MDIAIKFEKWSLDDDKCVFRPSTIIRGKYDKESDTFYSESGEVLDYIDGADMHCDSLFDYPTTIEKLKKRLGFGVSEEALLSEFFFEKLENIYLGFYTDDDTISLFRLPTYQMLDEYDDALDNENSTKSKITFDYEVVKRIHDAKSLKEVKKELDEVLSMARLLMGETVTEPKKVSKHKTKKFKTDRVGSGKFNLSSLRKEVLSKIVSQDNAVNRVTTAIAVNYTSKNPKHKSHILIAGPSGTGKTEMVNIVAQYLGVPYYKADATQYTKEGYVGKSVTSMLTGLIDAAGGDIEKAQRGILIIDEIDKKSGGDRSDPSTQPVLSSLLKMMDRGVIEVSNGYQECYFDTSNLTMIFMGAFSDLYRKKSALNRMPLGFSDAPSSGLKKKIEITKQDMIDDGMTAEFMGRIDEVIPTEEFDLDGLLEILYKSKISPIRIEREYFKDLGVRVVFYKSFYEEVAKKCLKSGTGARDLKRCVHESLTCAYTEVLDKSKCKILRFTKDTVNDPKKYYVS